MPSAPFVFALRRRLAWPRYAGAAMARGLLGLLLLLQLAGFHGRADAMSAHPDLAALSAAIGQPVAICHHGDGPAHQGAPDTCCPSCSLCHMLVGTAILPPAVALQVPGAFVAVAAKPHPTQAASRPRSASGPSPRGPPLLV